MFSFVCEQQQRQGLNAKDINGADSLAITTKIESVFSVICLTLNVSFQVVNFTNIFNATFKDANAPLDLHLISLDHVVEFKSWV